MSDIHIIHKTNFEHSIINTKHKNILAFWWEKEVKLLVIMTQKVNCKNNELYKSKIVYKNIV